MTSADGRNGVTTSTITKLERGERAASDATIRSVGEALNATVEEFPAYGLALARSFLDPDYVGLRRALWYAGLFTAAMALAEEDLADPLEEAAQLRDLQPERLAEVFGRTAHSGQG